VGTKGVALWIIFRTEWLSSGGRLISTSDDKRVTGKEI
jgi:endo-1,4-beta-D-glucanase Y